MAILHRRGAKADFNAQKMLGGEMAVTIDGSRKAYVAFAPGDVKELASKEDVQNIVDNFTNSVDKKISEAVEQVTTEAEEQIAAVIQKGEEVLDSIPADYQEIAESVAQHETEIATLTQSKSDAITVEKSGTSIVATDSSDKGFEQFRTYGGSKQEKTSGNQLLDMPDVEEATDSGITWSCKNGVVTARGTSVNITYSSNVNIYYDIPVVAGQYYISGTNGDIHVRAKITLSDGTSIDPENTTFTIDGTEKRLRIYIFVHSGRTVNAAVYPMLNAGTEALPWEPYTGGIPSPNPKYPQPIVSAGQKLVDGVVTDVGISKKLTGKNLLKNMATSQTRNGVTFTVNDDGTVTANGTASANAWFYVDIFNAKYDTDLIINGVPNGFSDSTFAMMLQYALDGATKYHTVNNINGIKVTIPSGAKNSTVALCVYQGQTVSNLVFKPMIRLASITDDTYEPYTEQTLTLNHVLRGIPLGTDIPEMFKSNALHMDGIYWNEEEQQYYIADTIDAERGVLVQNIGHYKLNSSLTIALSSKHIGCIYFDASSIGGKIKAPYICTHAKWCGIYPTALVYGVGISNEFSYNLWLFESSKTVAEAKAYFDTNDVFMDYILATPIETPLTDEEIIAYKTLHSNKPTTIITNDAGCFMEVEYVADTKTHIAQNYVPVTAFNNVLDRISALEQLHV